MGASNLAAKRAAKANRRKAIVAQKRKAEVVLASPAGRIALATQLPIQRCVLTHNLHEIGMGSLVLARGIAAGPLYMSAFLLDSFSRGVKDATFQVMGQRELDRYLGLLEESVPLVPLDPSHARKLLHDLVRWSATLGFRPAPEYALAERLFGSVDPSLCQTEFTFGQDGKPFYISEPNESLSAARVAVELLSDQVGTDDFDYLVAAPAE